MNTAIDTETPAPVWRIDATQLAATTAKIAKINTRAAKRALAGRIDLTSTPVEVTEIDADTKIEFTYTMYDVTIGGAAPCYNGWDFIATLDWDEHAGLIVRAVPGAAQTNRDGLRNGWCDHCKTSRNRRVTYVVRNQATGEQLQVGRSCIKDFIGWSGSVAFLDTPRQDDSSGEWFGTAGDRDYSPETVLAVAWAVIKLEGWVPASSYSGRPTKGLVYTALNPRCREDREWAAQIAPLADEAMGKAKEIRAYICSDEFTGDSDYVINLKAIAAATHVSGRNFGLLVSAPQAYAKHLEQTLIRQQRAVTGAASVWVGTEKERLAFTVTVVGIRYFDTDYGTSTLYTMLGDDGNLIKWFASSDKLGENQGARFSIVGTVKGHEEFQGVRATLVTRCKVVGELPVLVAA